MPTYCDQGCCSTVYGTVYGNTVRYGKNGFYRIFENWHRIFGKIRYSVRYGPFFRGLAVQSPWLCNLLLLMSLRTCKPWGWEGASSSCPRFCQRAPSGNACSTTSPCPADPAAGWAHFLPAAACPAPPHHLSPPAHFCQQPPQQTAGSGGGKGASPQAHSRALCSGAREVHRCEDVKLINVIIVSLAVWLAFDGACMYGGTELYGLAPYFCSYHIIR